MRIPHWILVTTLLGATAMGCRDSRGNTGGGGEEDSGVAADTGATDTGSVTPTDTGNSAMDAGRVDTGPCTPTGPENTPAACMDGLDNDCDNFADCRDFECSRNPAVTFCPDAGPTFTDTGPRDVIHPEDTAGCRPMGAENTPAACSDGIDNDCDGFRDCIDLNCSCQGTCASLRAGCTCSGSENSNSACMDGRDNDCNGFSDCADFACSRNTAVTICPAMDGGTPRDVVTFNDAGPRGDTTGCVRMGDENSSTTCGDGIDNDCDGFVDCSDRNCSCVGTCGAAVSGCTCRGAENANGTCMDGIDNDCNSFVDCADFTCSRNTAVTICPSDAGTGGNG
ncbi:MAG: hypothetical protein JNK72_22495 [Myxococcales bacterium]|nr:hypothetical protein [Myxococcales bacterium]